MYDMGTLGGSDLASGINDSGQVTGNFSTSLDGLTEHAFLWTPTVPNGTSGTMQDLGALDGITSEGLAINAHGQITGFVSPGTINAAGGDQAFLYDGTIHKLGALSGTYSVGHAINTSGMVTGIGGSVREGTANDAFLWIPTVPNGSTGTMHDLGNLYSGYLGREGYSEGNAINASGMVTGMSRVNQYADDHAFLYDGTMHDLGTLGGPDSKGLGINASGQIVGDSDDVAFIYDAADGMIDLNALIAPLSGWYLVQATAINDAGQIVGYGFSGDNTDVYDIFLLTPVPELSSFMLAALTGIAALTFHRRRPATVN